MKKYILGLIKNLFNPAVSIFSQIDDLSFVHRKSRVYAGSKIYKSRLGRYSYVGRFSTLVHADVGQFCSIAGGSFIGLGLHPLSNLSTSPLFISRKNGTRQSWVENNFFQEFKPVTIGNDVWIGTRVIIMGGVKIGNGAVIGAGAIVTKDVPDYAIAVGVPAKVVKYRFSPDIIEKLLELQWWNLSEEELKENIKEFQRNSINLDVIEKINSTSFKS